MVKVKVKVKLSLGLIKYHVMNTYSFVNKAPRYEEVFGSGCIAPYIPIIGNRWK
jgi:hypothetical protein